MRPSQCHEDESQLTEASGQVHLLNSKATIEKNFGPRYGREPPAPDLEQPPFLSFSPVEDSHFSRLISSSMDPRLYQSCEVRKLEEENLPVFLQQHHAAC